MKKKKPPVFCLAWDSVPDWERASPLLHPPFVGVGVPDRELASPLAPPRVLAWESVPNWEHCRLFALCRRVGFGAHFSLFLFLFRDPNLLFLFLSSVPGSVPEREHGRLFALCRRGFIPD